MLLGKFSGFRTMVMLIGLLVTAFPVHGEMKKSQTDDKVALVNGVPIEKAEFDAEVFRIQKAVLGFGKPLTCKQVSSLQSDVLESMIRREVLYQDSRKAGIKPDDDAVNKEMKTLRQQFSNESDYQKELSRRNVSEELLRSRLERNSSIKKYVEQHFVPEANVTNSDMIAYYEGHLDTFKQPLQVRVSHILIQTDPKWDKARKHEARKKIEKILKNLKKGGDFASLAREQSDGPTRTNGGELGYVRMGQLDKEFEGAVFALKAGEISDLIETDYGYHLFKVTDRKPATVLAYDAVKDKIRRFLIDEKAKQEADLYAKKLREKARVDVLLPEDVMTAKRP